MNKNPKITPEEIYRLAKLSRLKISDSDVKKYSLQMNDILEYVSQINEVDLDEIEPLIHVFDHNIKGRSDEIMGCSEQKESFKNAPEIEDDLFKVPPVMGEKVKSS